jgi:structural maintenance of chromosome 4
MIDAVDETASEVAPPSEVAAAPTAQPRLMIQRMVLENFKSYAGKQEIGPFDKNMSSVVGPNGSGKSNVIDSMLFVFGFKSNKMRQSKLSELIHSSEKHPALQYARVAVYFQDIIDREDGGFDVVPGSCLEVSREARRDNSSKYMVNGKTSNFTDVTKLLRQRGIDLDHNRFLILQGEVEQISMMKPKAPTAHEEGILEYLEDIIGSNCHVAPIEEAQKATEVLNDQRASKLNSLKASEHQMQQLEGSKTEAEQFIRTEAQLNEKRAAMYQKYAQQSQANVDEVEQKRSELEARQADEREKAKESTEKLSTLEKAHKKSKRDHDKTAAQLEKRRAGHSEPDPPHPHTPTHPRVRAARPRPRPRRSPHLTSPPLPGPLAARSRAEFQAFEREDIKHREELKHLKAQLKKTHASTEKDVKKQGEMQAELGALRQDLPRLEEEEQSLAGSIQQAEAEVAKMYESIKVETEPIRVKMEAKQREREPKAQSLAALRSDAEVAGSEAKLLAEKEEQSANELATAERDLKAHDESVERSGHELSTTESSLSSLQQQLKAAEQQQGAWKQQEDALVEEERACRAKYAEGKAAQGNASSRSSQLRALHKAQKDGSIPGVIGRLGSLGGIAPEFDVAVSTACGALDNIVVDNTSTAQKCVELMRQQQLGIATFIALDRQQHLQQKLAAPFKAPAGAQRLVDLVQCAKEEHRVAFYFALQDTLVCGDRQQASKIAFNGNKRHRVVTTDGVVINTSGTMEGGGKPQRGRMSAQQAQGEVLSDKELAQLLARADKAAQQLEELRCTRSGAQPEARAMQKEAKKLEVVLTKLRMHLEAASAQRKALEQCIERARSAGAGAKLSAAEIAQKKKLADQVKQLQKEIDTEQAAVDKADAAIAALQEQVLAAGGMKLRAQKSRLETLAETLTCVQQQQTKIRAQSEISEKAEAKLQASIAKQRAAATELEGKIEATKEQFKKLEDDAFAVMKEYERCQEELASKEAALQGMQEEYDEVKAAVAKVRTVAVEITAQIEDYARAIKDNQLKVKHWTDKLRTLREAAEQQSRELAAAPAADADTDADADGGQLAAPTLADLTPEQLEACDTQELQAEIAQLEEALAAMTPNLGAIAEYRTREAEWRGRLKEFDDVTGERDAQRRTYETLRKQRLDEFMAGFRIIGMRLKEMYQARAATLLARVLPPTAAAATHRRRRRRRRRRCPAPQPSLPFPTPRPRARPPARQPARPTRTASSRR